nr:hypothetical protein [Pseudomonadota bacterium]
TSAQGLGQQLAVANERLPLLGGRKATLNEGLALLNGRKAGMDERLPLLGGRMALVDGRKALLNEGLALLNGRKAALNEGLALLNGQKATLNEGLALVDGRLALAALTLAVFAVASPLDARAQDVAETGAAQTAAPNTVVAEPVASTSDGAEPAPTRIRIPGAIAQKSRQMILDYASPKTRELIVSHEEEIKQLNATAELTDEQRLRRDTLIRTRFLLMRDIVKSHPNLHASIRRMAGAHRYRRGVMLARKIMNNPEAYQQVLRRADPETANLIKRNNNSLRKISLMIKKENSNGQKSCDAHRMDALYKRMSGILDNQVGALERTGFVKTSLSE